MLRAKYFLADDQTEKAVEVFDESLQVYRELYDSDVELSRHWLALHYANALAKAKSPRYDEAAYWMLLSYRDEWEQTVGGLGLPATELSPVFHNLDNAMDLSLFQNHRAKNKVGCFESIVNCKGLYFESQATVEKLLKTATGEARKPLEELSGVRTKIAQLALDSKKSPSEKEQELVPLNARVHQLLDHARSLIGANEGAAKQSFLTADRVTESLSHDEAFVSFFRTPFSYEDTTAGTSLGESYLAFVVTADRPIEMIELSDAPAIEALQPTMGLATAQLRADYSSSPETSVESLHQTLRQLSDQLLTPLLPYVKGKTTVTFSPDSHLWSIPWECLLLEDGQYAIEQFNIRYVTTARELVPAVADTPQSTTAPVVFAAPDFGADISDGTGTNSEHPSRRDLGGAELPDSVAQLDETRPEAITAAAELNRLTGLQSKIYLGTQATEGSFKSLHSPRVLVAATHGFHLPDVSDDKVEKIDDESVLAAVEAADKPPVEEFKDPLLNCGLLLSGFNQRHKAGGLGDDGILTGLEIIATDLRGTELVVLSACQTGNGEIMTGQGVSSLRHAFQLAGAKAVISSLWDVSDAYTSRLMQDFFRSLAGNVKSDVALRQAKLQQISTLRRRFGVAHPFFWGAFTVTGR